MPQGTHIPVMLAEVLAALSLKEGDHLVDGTYGAGGYSRAALALGVRVSGFDRDPRAIAAAHATAAESGGRLTLFEACFSEMADMLGAQSANAVTLDLGYSSIQMEDPQYGLSFQTDGPLDMRLSGSGETASEWLNRASETEIADVLYRYGEEPAARRIARAIVADRPFETTRPLAELIRRVVRARHKTSGAPRPAGKPGTDPATRSFQAIRIHVNNELGELEEGLRSAERVLKPGGKLAVVSFHSLEDRIVKQFLRQRSATGGGVSRHQPLPGAPRQPTFAPPQKPQHPGAAEIAANPRARSATLRVAERLPHPRKENASWPGLARK